MSSSQKTAGQKMLTRSESEEESSDDNPISPTICAQKTKFTKTRSDMSASDYVCQLYEGQLSKYTNVVKGWQFRWFILDPKTGVLNYYLNDSERKHQPRGWVHLESAVINPSDEDSNTFTVNSSTGESFKLRAQDAKARQEWVNRLRAVSQYLALLPQSNTPSLSAVSGRDLNQSSTFSSNVSMALWDAFSSVRDHLDKAEQSSFLLCRTIDELPCSGPVRHIDRDMLMLKAACQSTLVCLSQCYCILQQQTYDNQSVKVIKTISKHDHPSSSHSSKRKSTY